MIETSSVPLLHRGEKLAGRYVIEERIGEGGMGEIYAAHDEETKARVAIKILRREVGLHPKVVQRFLREGRVAARLQSRHVTRVHELGVCKDHGILFCAFELLDGVDLAGVLARDGLAPIPLCVDRVMEAIAGVAEAHVNGIVHRDLKPANLFLVEPRGEVELVKVLDFGVAKAFKGGELAHGALTSTTAMVGSPLYMSPEHLQSSKDVDVRADIWSLGVILYELTTRALPFDGTSLGTLLASVLQGRPKPPESVRPDLPPALSTTILKCLARDPGARFSNVRELASALAPLGTQRSELALMEVELHFSSETSQTSVPTISASMPVAEVAPSSASPMQPSTPSSDSTQTSAVARKNRSLLIVAAGIVVLAATGLLGFYLAGR